MVHNPGFIQLVANDAEKVKNREDVDTIDVIDNIRYHLTSATIDDAFEKLSLIDKLLDMLGLDA